MRYPLTGTDEAEFRRGAACVNWPQDLIDFQVETGFWGDIAHRGRRLSPACIETMRAQMKTIPRANAPKRLPPLDSTNHQPQSKTAILQRINNDFVYHPPTGHDQTERYEMIRAALLDVATTVVALTPVSREQSVALTKLEEAMFFANAAIARNEKNESSS